MLLIFRSDKKNMHNDRCFYECSNCYVLSYTEAKITTIKRIYIKYCLSRVMKSSGKMLIFHIYKLITNLIIL